MATLLQHTSQADRITYLSFQFIMLCRLILVACLLLVSPIHGLRRPLPSLADPSTSSKIQLASSRMWGRKKKQKEELAKEEKEEEEQAGEEKKPSFWSQFFSSPQKEEDTSEESEQEDEPQQDAEKPAKKARGFGGIRLLGEPSNTTSSMLEEDGNSTSTVNSTTLDDGNVEDHQGEDSDSDSDSEDEDEADDVQASTHQSSSNQTAASTNRTKAPQDQQRRPTLLTLAGPPPPSQNMMMMRFNPEPSNQNQSTPALLLVQAIGPLIALVTRWSLLAWLYRKIAQTGEVYEPSQHFTWEVRNDRYHKDSSVLQNCFERNPPGITPLSYRRFLRIQRPRPRVGRNVHNKTVVVADLTPGGSAIDLEYMGHVVSFLCEKIQTGGFGRNVEIVLLLECPGGPVTLFGMAGCEIARLRQAGAHVTMCIDMVAASGGYMMASQADTIVAAPFAMVGSVGVISEIINVRDFLEQRGVKALELTAGENKRHLTLLGKVTKSKIQAAQEDLEKVHQSFIEMVRTQRPQVDLKKCDGSVVYGQEALDAGMIDVILTSEEYLDNQAKKGSLVLVLHKYNEAHKNFLLSYVMNLVPHLRKRVAGTKWGQVLIHSTFWTALTRSFFSQLWKR